MSYSLRIFGPVLSGGGFIEDVTKRSLGWRRSIRAQGGYWQGEFTLTGNVQNLARYFYQYLGYHLQESVGGAATWEGMIYEMDLTDEGETRRKSLDTLYNNVKVRYIDTANEIALTSAASDSTSISIYGQRDLIWPIDGQDQTAAEAVRDTKLAEYAYPWARPTGAILGEDDPATLIVRACGYCFTANWRYESAGDDTDDDLSTWLDEIITTDCEFLTAGGIESNTLSVRKKTRISMRAWDVITKLLEMGNNDLPVRAYVSNDRYFNYETIDTTPRYYKRGKGLFTGAGSVALINPWQIRPAVVRDVTYPIPKTEIGAWLTDARDWYMTEVEVMDMGANKPPRVILKTEDYEESEILVAQEAYQEMIRRMKEREL